MNQLERAEDVVFGNTVEALFVRALGRRMTPNCYTRAAKAGIELRGKIEAFYARETYYKVVREVANELFPQELPDRALFEMGSAFIAGFEETIIGKAILAAVRFIGPMRATRKLSGSFRSSNNYMQTEFKELGPGQAELTLSQTSGAPAYFEGVLTAALKVAGGKNVQVERVREDGPRCIFLLRWDP